MLHELGMPSHIKGYQYLRDAIIKVVNNIDILNQRIELTHYINSHQYYHISILMHLG